MSRTLISHGRAMEIVARDDLPPGMVGVALRGESGAPVWTYEGPGARFDTDASIQRMDTVRARLRTELERLEDALLQQQTDVGGVAARLTSDPSPPKHGARRAAEEQRRTGLCSSAAQRASSASASGGCCAGVSTRR